MTADPSVPLGPAACVAEFHAAFGCPVRQPFDPDSDLFRLRGDLGIEEAQEAADATALDNLAKELADQVYVTYGTGLTYGIDVDAAVEAVHRSNMSKLENGQPVLRHDGKILKGSGYVEADVSGALPDLCVAAGCRNPWEQDLLCHAHERLLHAGLLDPGEIPATAVAGDAPEAAVELPVAPAVRPPAMRLSGAGWTCACGRRNRVAVRLCGSCRSGSPLTEQQVRSLQGPASR